MQQEPKCKDCISRIEFIDGKAFIRVQREECKMCLLVSAAYDQIDYTPGKKTHKEMEIINAQKEIKKIACEYLGIPYTED